MLRLQIVFVLLISLCFSLTGQTERVMEPSTKMELSKKGFGDYLSKWTPRLEEAIAIEDQKSIEAILDKMVEDISQIKEDLSMAEKETDPAFVAYLNRLNYVLMEKKDPRSCLQLMKRILANIQ